MKFLLLFLSVLAVFGKRERDAQGKLVKKTPEQQTAARAARKQAQTDARAANLAKRAAKKANTKKPRDGTKAPKDPNYIKVTSYKNIKVIKADLLTQTDTIKGLTEKGAQEDFIKGRIRSFLTTYKEGAENNEENVTALYAKLHAKKGEGVVKEGKQKGKNASGHGLFNKLNEYSKVKVKDLRKTERERLLAEAQAAFLVSVNSANDYTGPDITDLQQAIKLVQAAKDKQLKNPKAKDPKGARWTRDQKEQAKVDAGGEAQDLEGEGKRNTPLHAAKLALKKAKNAAKRFDKRSKYGAWTQRLVHDNKQLENSLAQLEYGKKKISKACQRIKIDLRKEKIAKEAQLDQFVQRLAERGLEGWAQSILFKNAQDLTVCTNKKITDHYNSKKAENAQNVIDAQARHDNAPANWAAREFNTKADAKNPIVSNGETNGAKQARLKGLWDAAKTAYTQAKASADENAKPSGLANLKIPRINQFQKQAKDNVKKQQGKKRNPAGTP